jgi:cell division protein FtsL
MAAIATTYRESCRGRGEGVAGWNAGLMARQQQRRRGARTPEFYFAKRLDNSRLVKAPDMRRVRQMRVFSVAVAVLFSLIMIYGLQHFSAIESGYRVEQEKQALDKLKEENRQLKLSEAQLTEPSRLDREAQQLGLVEPQPNQVIRPGAMPSEAGSPVLAQVSVPSSAVQ